MPELEELLADGWEKIETGSADKAREIACKALSIVPDSSEAHSLLGSALMILGNPEAALREFDASLDIDSLQPEALLNKIEILAFDMDQPEEALAVCEEARGKAPMEDVTLRSALQNMKGRIMLDLGELQEALDAFSESVKISDEIAETYAWIAMILFDMWRFDEVEVNALKALKIDAWDPLALHCLGLVKERAGDFAEARKYFLDAHKSDPEGYAEPLQLTAEDFQSVVEEAVMGLPETVRQYLVNVPITTEDIPEPEDCANGDIPLSPRIPAIFRSTVASDDGEADSKEPPANSIAVFRLNILRNCETREEAIEDVRAAVLEEVRNFLGLSESELLSGGLS